MEEVFISCSVGLGVLACIVFVIGIFHMLYLWLILSILGICFLWGLTAIIQLHQRVVNHLSDWFRKWRRAPRLTSIGMLLLVLVILVGVFLPVLILPLYPPTQFDATAYYLPLTKTFVQTHEIGFTPTLRVPVYPSMSEMLFALVFLMHDDVSIQVFQTLVMLLISMGLYAGARAVFSHQVGIWAMALWLTNPLVLWLGSVAYVDINVTLFLAAAALSCWRWLDSRHLAWLIVTAVFCGFAAGSKYTAIYFLVPLGLIVLHAGIRSRDYKLAGMFGLVVLLVAAPWYVRNAYYTGNPFFPFFPELFGQSEAWSAEDLQDQMGSLLSRGSGRSILAWVLLPWNLAFHQEAFGAEAEISPIYLFALPFLIAFAIWNSKVRGILAFVLAYTLFWFMGAQIMRHLLPAILMLSLITAAMLERSISFLPHLRRHKDRIVITIVGFALLIAQGSLYALETVQRQGSPPTMREQRDAYLAERLPSSYSAYKFLNELKGRSYTLYALFDENMMYFADGTFMGDWFGPARYNRITDRLQDGQALYKELKILGANYLLLSKHRIRVNLPDDEFFNSHFKLVYARANVLLFELSEKPLRRSVGPELLENSGFDTLEGPWPSGWRHAGSPVIDASGQYSNSGLVAVRGEGARNVFYQTVEVRPGKLYVLSLYARTFEKNQYTRLQVNWSDAQGKFLFTDIEVVEVGANWKRYEMPVRGTEEAVSATIYASPHEQDSVWFDTFSFVEVMYKDEP